jgi:hypothetical protein
MTSQVRWFWRFVLIIALLAVGCAPVGPESLRTAVTSQAGDVPSSASSPIAVPSAEAPPDEATEGALLVSFEQRPLRLPDLKPNGLCPTSQWQLVRRLLPDSPQWAGYFAFGDGPIYAIIYGTETTGYLSAADLLRGTVKTRWFATPDYQGPALIRGRQIGESTPITFAAEGANPSRPSLDFRSDTMSDVRIAAGWRTQAASIEALNPGCYAFQVDGLDLLEFIVFEVTG